MHVDSSGTIRPTRVRSHFNYKFNRSLPRVLTLPSCTIPDQVLTIEEILRRYARDPASVPPANPVFDSPYPDLKGMDRLDKAQMAMDIKQNVQDYEKAVEAEKAAQIALAKKASEEEATKSKQQPTPVPAPAPAETTTPPSTPKQ